MSRTTLASAGTASMTSFGADVTTAWKTDDRPVRKVEQRQQRDRSLVTAKRCREAADTIQTSTTSSKAAMDAAKNMPAWMTKATEEPKEPTPKAPMNRRVCVLSTHGLFCNAFDSCDCGVHKVDYENLRANLTLFLNTNPELTNTMGKHYLKMNLRPNTVATKMITIVIPKN
eukprot:4663794-Amphidinium_carterae.1